MILQCKECHHKGEVAIQEIGPHTTAYCKACGAYIKHIPKNRTDVTDFTLYFGKWKGEKISQMNTPERISWLRWAYENVDFKDWQKEIVKKRIGV